MSIYQLPQEIIRLIIQRIPKKLHFVLRCIKIFAPHITGNIAVKMKAILYAKYVIKCNSINILHEFLAENFFKRSYIHLLCEDAIVDDRLECLVYLMSRGAVYKSYWIILAAEYSTKIFAYLVSKYNVSDADIHKCRMCAMFANKLEILESISNYPVKVYEFIYAIKNSTLEVIEILARDFWCANKNPKFIMIAKSYQREDIAKYLDMVTKKLNN